jgi:hypothetical protein
MDAVSLRVDGCGNGSRTAKPGLTLVVREYLRWLGRVRPNDRSLLVRVPIYGLVRVRVSPLFELHASEGEWKTPDFAEAYQFVKGSALPSSLLVFPCFGTIAMRLVRKPGNGERPFRLCTRHLDLLWTMGHSQ